MLLQEPLHATNSAQCKTVKCQYKPVLHPDDPASSPATLGGNFMSEHVVIFDSENKRIGFAKSTCTWSKVAQSLNGSDGANQSSITISSTAAPRPSPMHKLPKTREVSPAKTFKKIGGIEMVTMSLPMLGAVVAVCLFVVLCAMRAYGCFDATKKKTVADHE